MTNLTKSKVASSSVARPVLVEPVSGSATGAYDWQEDALCTQVDPELFFPDKGGSAREAKLICQSCVVREICLEYALENHEQVGIWGGLSGEERKAQRRQRELRVAA
jgi:WhiB family redox-sensing transcriptional regulator